MKTPKIKLTLLVLALALLFSGCAHTPTEDEDAAQDKATEYLNTIATLETQLEEARTAFAQSEAAYKQTIADLEAQIARLSATQSPGSGGEESVQFRYRIEKGGAVITGYEGSVALLTIPEALDGYPVISIGERAFENASLSAVVIPEGVQEIGWFAFYNCHTLINVTLPQSVSSIGYAVFDGCGALTLFCAADSYAERYARSYGLSCVTK